MYRRPELISAGSVLPACAAAGVPISSLRPAAAVAYTAHTPAAAAAADGGSGGTAAVAGGGAPESTAGSSIEGASGAVNGAAANVKISLESEGRVPPVLDLAAMWKVLDESETAAATANKKSAPNAGGNSKQEEEDLPSFPSSLAAALVRRSFRQAHDQELSSTTTTTTRAQLTAVQRALVFAQAPLQQISSCCVRSDNSSCSGSSSHSAFLSLLKNNSNGPAAALVGQRRFARAAAHLGFSSSNTVDAAANAAEAFTNARGHPSAAFSRLLLLENTAATQQSGVDDVSLSSGSASDGSSNGDSNRAVPSLAQAATSASVAEAHALVKLIRAPWFAGLLAPREAHALVQGSDPGCFLAYAEVAPKTGAAAAAGASANSSVAAASKDEEPMHLRVLRSAPGGTVVEAWSTAIGRTSNQISSSSSSSARSSNAAAPPALTFVLPPPRVVSVRLTSCTATASESPQLACVMFVFSAGRAVPGAVPLQSATTTSAAAAGAQVVEYSGADGRGAKSAHDCGSSSDGGGGGELVRTSKLVRKTSAQKKSGPSSGGRKVSSSSSGSSLNRGSSARLPASPGVLDDRKRSRSSSLANDATKASSFAGELAEGEWIAEVRVVNDLATQACVGLTMVSNTGRAIVDVTPSRSGSMRQNSTAVDEASNVTESSHRHHVGRRAWQTCVWAATPGCAIVGLQGKFATLLPPPPSPGLPSAAPSADGAASGAPSVTDGSGSNPFTFGNEATPAATPAAPAQQPASPVPFTFGGATLAVTPPLSAAASAGGGGGASTTFTFGEPSSSVGSSPPATVAAAPTPAPFVFGQTSPTPAAPPALSTEVPFVFGSSSEISSSVTSAGTGSIGQPVDSKLLLF